MKAEKGTLSKSSFRWISVDDMPFSLPPKEFRGQYAKLLDKYAVWKLVVEVDKSTRALVFDRKVVRGS